MDGTIFSKIPDIEEIKKQNYNLAASQYIEQSLIPTREDLERTVREYLKFRIGQILEGRG